MRSVESSWPEGEWVTEGGKILPIVGPTGPTDGASESAVSPPRERPADPPSVTHSLTIIGGTKYDEDEFWNFIVEQGSLYTDDNPPHFVVGDGRGVEGDLQKSTAWSERDQLIALDPDRFGKNARKVNVEQVLSFAPQSPVLLVGTGERVKQAKAWLKRANWGREVIELP